MLAACETCQQMLSAHSKAPSQLNIPSANNVVLVSLGTNLEVILNGTLKATNSTWQLLQYVSLLSPRSVINVLLLQIPLPYAL